MIPSRIECGCAQTKCGGGVVGQPSCEYCGGEGYRLVQCVACSDTGWMFGGDGRCDCGAARLVPARSDPESMRLAREFEVLMAANHGS